MPTKKKLTPRQQEELWSNVAKMGKIFICFLGTVAVVMAIGFVSVFFDASRYKIDSKKRQDELRKTFYGEYTLDEKFEKFNKAKGITVTSQDRFGHRDWQNKEVMVQWYDPETLSVDNIRLNMREAWILSESTNKKRRELGLEIFEFSNETNMIRLLKAKWERQEKQ